MIPIKTQARDKRERLKDAHTKQLYEEPEVSILLLEAIDVITTSGEQNGDVNLPKVIF